MHLQHCQRLTYGVCFMDARLRVDRPEPTNDQQRTIAKAFDSKMLTDSSYGYVVSEVVESMPFDLSNADIQFLFNYAHWQRENRLHSRARSIWRKAKGIPPGR